LTLIDEKSDVKQNTNRLINCAMQLYLIIFCLLSMIFTTGLLIYHTTIIIRNMTTKEELKGAFKNNFGNPNNRSCSRNLKNVLFPKISQMSILDKLKKIINKKSSVVKNYIYEFLFFKSKQKI